MEFIHRKEKRAGVTFVRLLLDTHLLSMVAAPEAEDHSLAATGRRLGVAMRGRHTALGDCWITAQIFVRLLELLNTQGITTLGQALAACRQVR